MVVGHLFRQPQGVFAALDIFFVLSGFVITAVLLDMDAKHGRIYFTPFYLARIRRLLPMALVVTVATIGLTYYVFSSARGALVAKDGLWSSLFVANWHFANQGVDYFYDSSESPFLHYWSLSVEEQFYAVWPLLLLALLFAFRRLRHQRALLFGAVTVVALISFGYSMWHSVASPTVAYFSTLDRVWEFAAGGLLAIARPELKRIPPRFAAVMAWVGFWSLAAPVFLLEYGMPFPAPWGLAPVLCTAAIVAGGVGRDTRHLVMLDNRVMTYIGDISYSVYLWHLPAIILLEPFFPDSPALYSVAVLTATAVLSVVSYHLIEKPMRYAKWLMTPPEKRAQRRRGKPNRKPLRNGWIAVLVVTTVVLTTAAVVDVRPDETAVSAASPRPAPAPSATADVLPGSALVVAQQAALGQALQATEFPELEPDLGDLGVEQWLGDLSDLGCVRSLRGDPTRCTSGDDGASRLAVVVGDSYALSWMPALRAALPPDWRLQQLTELECASWTLPSYVRSDGTPYPECADLHDYAEQFIEDEQPDLVIIASATAQVRNAERPDITQDRDEIAQAGLAAALRLYGPHTDQIVVLAPPPGSGRLLDCVTRFGSPADCVNRPSADWRLHTAGERAAASELGAEYVETEDWFCVQGRCPAFVGATPVTVDGSHLSIQYGEQLAPLLAETVFGVQPAAP